jgi:hypothetical protein
MQMMKCVEWFLAATEYAIECFEFDYEKDGSTGFGNFFVSLKLFILYGLRGYETQRVNVAFPCAFT